MKNKVLFIVGPTGVGKTALAFEIADKFNGNLISADSVQVYKGLDIISGKDIPKSSKFTLFRGVFDKKFNSGFYTFKKIPIFLLDVVSPSYSFSVSDFNNLTSEYIQSSLQQNKLPIVVGGTGLYIKSLIDGIDNNLVSPNLKLRERLSELSVLDLQEILKKRDNSKFERMNNSDANNKRRLVRAIEILESGIKNYESGIKNYEKFECLVVGLKCEIEVLKKRIDARVEERLKNGALKEAEGLFKKYQSLSPQVKNANGYKQIFQYLKKEISFEEAIYRWKISEYRHAKNQMTWFRKYGNVRWFDVEDKSFKIKIQNEVSKFYLI